MSARPLYDEQLQTLHEELDQMAHTVSKAIESAIDIVAKPDKAMAMAVIARDSEVDRQEREIETMCIKLFLQQQPVASDLRDVSAALKMITDLERIGDQAADICSLVLASDVPCELGGIVHLRQMASMALAMVRLAIDAFINHDLEQARSIPAKDDLVDELFMTVRDECVVLIREGDTDCGEIVDVLMIAKYLERIADHAVNISEWAEYALTGVHKGEQIALG